MIEGVEDFLAMQGDGLLSEIAPEGSDGLVGGNYICYYLLQTVEVECLRHCPLPPLLPLHSLLLSSHQFQHLRSQLFQSLWRVLFLHLKQDGTYSAFYKGIECYFEVL